MYRSNKPIAFDNPFFLLHFQILYVCWSEGGKVRKKVVLLLFVDQAEKTITGNLNTNFSFIFKAWTLWWRGKKLIKKILLDANPSHGTIFLMCKQYYPKGHNRKQVNNIMTTYFYYFFSITIIGLGDKNFASNILVAIILSSADWFLFSFVYSYSKT